MNSDLQKKYKLLQDFLAKYDELTVAYSGGVDSTLLLKVAKDVLNDKVHAIIGKSPSTPEKEFEGAIEIARNIGVEPIVIITNEIYSPEYIKNPPERCYYCKQIIFGSFIAHLKKIGLKNLADGSNFDDLNDYRPGHKALQEFGVISPFRETGFRKIEIRELSKFLILPTWNKEALACLATRIAYGEKITLEKLKMVERAEDYLRESGFTSVRARFQSGHLRIETSVELIPRFLEGSLREQIIATMKEIGFTYITVDLEGYRMGSMNPEKGKVQ